MLRNTQRKMVVRIKHRIESGSDEEQRTTREKACYGGSMQGLRFNVKVKTLI